jgi:regulator of nucleoside diphosphate kinase
MSTKPIQITEHDLERLKEMLLKASYTDQRDSEYLERLEKELERAEVVSPQEVARTVITMNSTVVLLDLDTNERETYTLVFPEEADIGRGKISILAPIGTGMLGYEVGDVFEWPVPAGVRRLQVAEILYQPEAEGDWDR